MTFDLILSGGQLLDGTGTPAVAADLGIIGERIEAIGDLSRAQARRVIPLQGLTVAPGFIDTHTHSEGALLHDPRHAYGLRQGITTEIVGLDGMSWAPLSQANFRLYARYLGGILGDPPPDLNMSSIAAFREHYHRKAAVNVAYLVPHGALRLELLGFRDLPLRGEALQAAGRMLRQGIDQGAVGFSTGAAYYPGYWADTRELVELCRVVREAGGVYVNEPRVGTPQRAFGGGGILEGLEIARQSGAPVHFAHLRTTEQTAGRLQELTAPIDRAQQQGVDCTMDIYPYPSGSSIAVSFLPGEMQEGGPLAILERLADPGRRRALQDYLENRLFAPLEPVTFSYLPRNPHLEGKSLAEAARRRGASPAQTLCDLLLGGRSQGRLRQRTAFKPDAAGIHRQGLPAVAGPSRRHGLQRHHAPGKRPPPPLLRSLPQVSGTAAAALPDSEPGNDGSTDDGRAGAPLRIDPAGPAAAGVFRRPGGLRPRDGHRHRHL